ncbi:MAG: hypothetical protein JXJ22_01265 [Bacteroidales bacterium]|nr:hypothetical protein [Bacteroidales bacterium]
METQSTEVEKRPAFLTVLCILSFIGLGYVILTNLLFLPLTPFFSHLIPDFKELIQDNFYSGPFENFVYDAINVAEKAMEFAWAISLSKMLLAALALWGVILMWQLKKNGFYLYALAKIVIITLPIIFLGYNFIAAIGVISGGFFALIFIVLYALNLKSMK